MKLASNVRAGISAMVCALGRGAVLALLIAPVCGAPALAQTITVLASVDNLGTQLPNASGSPSISADGRFVVFTGGVSANLVGGCTGGILVRDLAAGTTTCVASGSNPVISGNGRFVAFQSTDTTLDPACTNMTFTGHTFVRDLVLGSCSASPPGSPAGTTAPSGSPTAPW